MRIRRSVKQFFGTLVIPAIADSHSSPYFGYYTIFGTRGLLGFVRRPGAPVSEAEKKPYSIRNDRSHLEHRIQLLQPGSVDPDLVEEIARGQMLGSAPGQVAVPRDKQ